MRWAQPKIGSSRVKKRFAWFPRKIYLNNSESLYPEHVTIWLETYWEHQVYTHSAYHDRRTRNYWKIVEQSLTKIEK